MTTTDITINDENVRLTVDMKKLKAFETNVMSMSKVFAGLRKQDVLVSTIPSFYYYFQTNTAYSEEVWFDKVMKQI